MNTTSGFYIPSLDGKAFGKIPAFYTRPMARIFLKRNYEGRFIPVAKYLRQTPNTRCFSHTESFWRKPRRENPRFLYDFPFKIEKVVTIFKKENRLSRHLPICFYKASARIKMLRRYYRSLCKIILFLTAGIQNFV